jgi:hypothetical protein
MKLFNGMSSGGVLFVVDTRRMREIPSTQYRDW